jgi:hypothetical protein
MKNELRARLAYALEVSEQRRMGLRNQLEKIVSDEGRPIEAGRPRFEGSREQDKCEQELMLAEEWCAATRALADWLGGELLDDPVPEDHDSANFYNRPHQPGSQVSPERMDRKALRG